MSAVLLLVVVVAPYLAGVARARRPWPWWRTAAFAGGAVALAASTWPALDAGAADRLRAHMLEHLLLGLAAPLLLALGAPVRLALAALPRGGRRAVGGALGHPAVHLLGRAPLVTALLFAVTVAVHLPGAIDLAERSPTAHAAEHAALFWAGLLFWAVVLAADPVPAPPSPIARVVWIQAAMAAMVLTGARYTSAPRPLVEAYAARPGALGDQVAAGTLMWLGGAALMVPALLAVVMGAMLAEERRQRRREALR